MKSSFANHLTLICALAVFAFAAFALHVDLKAAPQPVTEVTRAAKQRAAAAVIYINQLEYLRGSPFDWHWLRNRTTHAVLSTSFRDRNVTHRDRWCRLSAEISALTVSHAR
ncbi:MAG: hypothetical protein WCD82_20185 [Xanthobacteraceae bacterium]|jgi:hypothetical protein